LRPHIGTCCERKKILYTGSSKLMRRRHAVVLNRDCQQHKMSSATLWLHFMVFMNCIAAFYSNVLYEMVSFKKQKLKDPLIREAKTRVNVMVTVFGDFRQFLCDTIAVFLKNQCYDPIFT
jgi:hypothetical protein